MKLLEKKDNNYEFLIETLDDLWILSQYINVDDKIFGKAQRKVKIGSETNYKVSKKNIFVELLVKQVKFENKQLRIIGEIQNETQFTTIGMSQSLSYNLSDKIKLEKNTVLKYQKKLIENTIKSKNSYNLVVLLDKDDIVVFEYSSFSYNILFHKTGLGSKKYTNTQINQEKEKYDLIKEFLQRDYSNIIFVGPGLFKNDLQKYTSNNISKKILTLKYNEINLHNISKLIREINKKAIFEDSQISYENKYISKLLENINKSSKYAYGKDNVYNSVNIGSCETLLVTTKFIDNLKENLNEYLELNEIMKTVENLNGELVIVDSKYENGRILDGIGGIGAILRY
ncbi:MAG: hypothetical protein ACOC16_00845 [Nanoarchaeota archaeon]